VTEDAPKKKVEEKRPLTSKISWFKRRYAFKNSPASPVSLTSGAFELFGPVDVR